MSEADLSPEARLHLAWLAFYKLLKKTRGVAGSAQFLREQTAKIEREGALEQPSGDNVVVLTR